MDHSNTAIAVQTKDLSKRYGPLWALENCTIEIPSGSIVALVGANGAGKSTLLQLLSGLNMPTRGMSSIFGRDTAKDQSSFTDVSYLAQEIPLYKDFSAVDYSTLGAHMSKTWDADLIRDRMNDLGIPLDRAVGTMSGGQRAQVALAVALAKKPRVLLLDEPVAALDPLARRDFLSSLGQAVVDSDVTVVMSSHLLADLELICDHVIILSEGHVQLCDNIDHVVQTHKILVGAREGTPEASNYTIISETQTPKQTTLLVKTNDKFMADSHWHIHEPTIEDIVLAYMGQHAKRTTQQSTKTGDAS